MYEIHEKHIQYNICKDDHENIIYFICYNNKIHKRYMHKFIFDTQKDCNYTLNILINMMSKISTNYTYVKKYYNTSLVLEFNRKINNTYKIIMKGEYMSIKDKKLSNIYFKLLDDYDLISIKKIGKKYGYYIRKNNYKYIVITDNIKFNLNFYQVYCKKVYLNIHYIDFGVLPYHIDHLIIDYSFNNNITEYSPSLDLDIKLLNVNINTLEICNVKYDFDNNNNREYMIKFIDEHNINDLIISCNVHSQFFDYIDFMNYINSKSKKYVVKLNNNNTENIKSKEIIKTEEIIESKETDEISRLILDNIEIFEQLV